MTDLAITTPQPAHYELMVSAIGEAMPSVLESSQSFYKSDSQIKTVSLDITELTDIGAAKHILARIERKRQALKESEISVRRKRLQVKRLEEQLSEAYGIDADELGLDIVELESQIEDTTNYQRGAIREVAFLVAQYEAICARLGVDVITELMYENDQAKAQVMRAFSQALAAARARHGSIDEGNFIYLQDLGVNGAAAQNEVSAYLEAEQSVIDSGRTPTFEMQRAWLDAVGDKYSPEVIRYAEWRGLVPQVRSALAQQQTDGNTDE